MATWTGTSALLRPSGGGAGQVGPRGKGQTPEGLAWSHKSRATVDYTPIGVEPHKPT